MTLQIKILPILEDNYAYIIQSGDTVGVIDPGEAKPIVDYLTEQGLDLNWIINTHHHWDHTDGNIELRDAYDCKWAAPDECGEADVILREGEVFKFGDTLFDIFLTKGHTARHIVLFDPETKSLFSGDTLFAMGCGRLFEGSAEDMFGAMEKIKFLPPETKIYCGHEYTLTNAKFAAHALPDNHDIAARLEQVKSMDCTMPTTLAQELETNPFLIADTVDQFARYRKARDGF